MGDPIVRTAIPEPVMTSASLKTLLVRAISVDGR
jgi:hypothetical protein